MSPRDSLLAMGFNPQRIDWAIRETLPSGDIQIAIDHIVEHESQPIPAPNAPPPLPIRPIRSPTIVHPTPSRLPTGSDVAAQEALIRNMESLGISQDSSQALLEQPYAGSLARFRAFLQVEQSIMFGTTVDDYPEAQEKAYQELETFFRQELARRREHYGLPPMNTTRRASMQSINLAPPPSQTSHKSPTLSSRSQPAEAEMWPAPSISTRHKAKVLSLDTTKKAARTIIPESTELESVLDAIDPEVVQDQEAQSALERARELRPQFSDRVWNLRQEFESARMLISASQVEQDNQRQKAHSNKLTTLYETNQYEAVAALDESFQKTEKANVKARNEQEFQQWKVEVADVGTAGCMEALQNLQEEYGLVEDIITEPSTGTDILHAVRALEEISNIMENEAVATIESLEDDVSQRSHQLQTQALWSDTTQEDVWGHGRELDEVKVASDLELAVVRAQYKINRTAPCYNLLLSQLRAELARIESDEAYLGAALLQVVNTVPPILTPREEEEEEAVTRAAGKVWRPSAIPSEALIAQIRRAHSMLCDLSARAGELLHAIRQLSEKQRDIVQRARVKEVLSAEHRGGRGENAWFSENMKIANADGEQAAMAIVNQYNKDEEERTQRFKPFGGPTLELLGKAKEREMALSGRLGTVARSTSSSGSKPYTAVANEPMAKLLQQQQQTQMVSNMMWGQHASRTAIINNVGSSSTQWTVGYK